MIRNNILEVGINYDNPLSVMFTYTNVLGGGCNNERNELQQFDAFLRFLP